MGKRNTPSSHVNQQKRLQLWHKCEFVRDLLKAHNAGCHDNTRLSGFWCVSHGFIIKNNTFINIKKDLIPWLSHRHVLWLWLVQNAEKLFDFQFFSPDLKSPSTAGSIAGFSRHFLHIQLHVRVEELHLIKYSINNVRTQTWRPVLSQAYVVTLGSCFCGGSAGGGSWWGFCCFLHTMFDFGTSQVQCLCSRWPIGCWLGFVL